MKKKLIFLLTLFLSTAQFAGAQCLVLNATSEFSLGIGGAKEFTISGPASTLSYDARTTGLWPIGNFQVYQKVNGAWEQVQSIGTGSLTSSYKSFSVQLNSSATAIKYEFPVGGSYKRYFRNIKVTQASYINVSPSDINFGTVEIGKTTTKTINVAYSSKLGSVSSSNAGIFSVDKSSVGDNNCGYGNTTVQVTFKPTSTGSVAATINVDGNNVAVTGIGSLAIPSGLTASNVSYTSLNLSWNAVTGASAYLVTNTTTNTTYKVSSTSTAISGLIPNHSYTFNVKSLDASDNASAASTPVSITTKTIGVPANFQVSNISYISANFSWNAVDGASAYLLTNVTTGKTYKLSSTSTTISDLTPDNTYAFNVRSLDAYDNTYVASSNVSVTTKTIGVPTNLQISDIGYGSANLSWNAVVDAEAYNIINEITNETTTVYDTTFGFEGLAHSTTYQIKVTAVIGEYQSNQASVGFTTKSFEKPSNECYLLNDSQEYTLFTIQATDPFEWGSGIPNMLYFKAKRDVLGFNFFFVQQYISGNWVDLANPSLSSTYSNYAYQLSENATAVRFYAKTGATLTKYIKEIQVTLKNSLSVSTTSLDFGSVQIGKTAQRTFTANYANIADLALQSDNEYYTVSYDAAPACSFGQRTFTITYAPKVLDTPQSSSLVLYNGLSATIKVTGATTPLPAPTNFRVAQASAHSIPLLWDAVEGATGYRLTNTTTSEVIDLTETSYTFDDLNAHSDYAFTVSSLYNNEVCGTSSFSTKTYTPLYVGVLGNAADCISSSVTLVSGDMNSEDNSYKVGSEIKLNVNSNNESVEIKITANGEALELPNNILLKGGDIVSINAEYTGVALVIDGKVYSTLTEAVNNAGNRNVVLLNDVEENLVIKTQLVLDGGDFSINNLIVNANGSLVLNGDITVASFNIQTQNGVSGEFREDGGHLTVLGSVSMDKSLDPSGTVSPKKWYGFSVPFPVSLKDGIYRKSGDQIIKMVYGDQYVVKEYDGAKRAATGSGWVMTDVNATLQPGKFYIFASNGYNEIRFVKAEGAPLISSQTTLSVSEFASAKLKDTGWNGLANTQLFHVDVNSDVMFAQVYKNGAKEYLTVSLFDESFVVGVPFFIQQGKGMSSVLDLAKRTHNSLRSASENISSIYNLRMAVTGSSEMSDQLFVSANESASESYVIGKDLEKMGTPTSASIAQLWCVDYDNTNLSVYEAKLKDGAANLVFRMYAPAAANYTLYLNPNNIPNDGSTLYLLKDGVAVHNFNNDGEYSFASNKGLISNYELLIKAAEDISTVVSADMENGVFAYIEGDVLYVKNISESSSYVVGNSIRTLYSGESDGSDLALPVIEKGMYWIKVGNQTIKLIKK